MNLNNYILQQNILASGKLFIKICSRAHENKWSQGLPYRISSANLGTLSVLYLHPTKKPSQRLHSLTVLRNDDKTTITFPPSRGCSSTNRAIWTKIWKALL